jgi:phospholipid/cholesterol/gamma-HCH transport system substrate-binding protein
VRRALVASSVAALLAALGAGCAPAGGRTVVAEFAEVGDLVSRANVQQSDAVVGSVRRIELVERGDRWLAQVEMRLQDDVSVPEGSRAVVRSTSLLGEKYVDLVRPDKPGGRELSEGGVIPATATDKAPELEDLFSRLGAILQGGALEDLARLSTAGAMILEGQEENVGRVIDGTAKLVASLRREREALAAGLDDLSSASRTLAENSDTLDNALDVSADALAIVAAQRDDLEELVIQLDRLAAPLAKLTREHQDDIDAQVRAVRNVVPKLYEVRKTLEDAVVKLPSFTKLFAEAAPGDYVQLNVLVEALPVDLGPSVNSSSMSLQDLLLEAAR